MGKIWRELTKQDGVPTTTVDMRIHCQRPGKSDSEGKPIYFTEQSHKDQCDVNNIIKKYDRDGLILHISKFEGKFGDMSGLDFKEIHDKVINAKLMFDELPSEIRNRFRNSPQELLTFMDDPGNREEAIKLGIVREEWTPETDGIGEHVKEGENIVKEEENNEV